MSWNITEIFPNCWDFLMETGKLSLIKILSCWLNTRSRQGIKQLLISFSSIFPLFSYENNRGSCL